MVPCQWLDKPEKRSIMICHQCNNIRGQLSSVSKCWSWRSQVPDPPHAKALKTVGRLPSISCSVLSEVGIHHPRLRSQKQVPNQQVLKDQCYPTAWGWLGTAMWRQLGSRTVDRESLNSVNQAPGHQRVQAFCRQATQTDTLLLPESFGCPLFAQPSLAKRVSQRKCTTLRQLKAFCNHLCQWRVPALVAT